MTNEEFNEAEYEKWLNPPGDPLPEVSPPAPVLEPTDEDVSDEEVLADEDIDIEDVGEEDTLLGKIKGLFS